MLRSILVAIDGSSSCGRAMDRATELALGLNARLTILSVVVPLPAVAYAADIDARSLEAESVKQTEGVLRAASDRVPDGLPVEVRLRFGHAAAEIVKEVEESDHDLVVVGTRGRGRLASNLLGSVAGDVHFHSSVDLLVVHPSEP
ncbi:MAG: universal stress protein [Solirubrobacterales bacterium]|nr:universal stress protein [Solirubrobacterales bacterium]MCB8970524.1 universal stress protein [Thermoleophilales bacterium]MCO5325686.1 universal stress protein [Solirubrobacterales bacterium]